MTTALRVAHDECSALDLSPSDATSKVNLLGEHLRALRATGTRQHFGRNEQIFGEGDPADRVCMIVSGTVRLCRHTASGRRHISDFAAAGDLIGFGERPHQSHAAEAVTPVIVTTYRRSNLEQLAGANPKVRSSLCSLLAANLFAAQRQLCVLGCQNAKERLASFLLHLADRMQTQAGELLNLPMGRLDIADHLGLTIETVCRAIAALKADRIVLVPTAHQLILSNVVALRALAQGV
jgi:CRP-like cAMP-binding protein